MKKISIIIPIYNEEKTLSQIVERVQKVRFNTLSKELIIVNDASQDNSQREIDKISKKYNNIISLNHEKNQGKGAAIRTGIKRATGEIITIQDGDLEYNPEDFKKLVKPIIQGKEKVVYGSRLMGHIYGFNIPSHYYGNKFLSLLTQTLYRKKVTDMETCYKVISKEALDTIELKSNRFEIEPEITTKLIKKGYNIHEIPIGYNCRSFKEGKKITWMDGIQAIKTLLKYRFSN